MSIKEGVDPPKPMRMPLGLTYPRWFSTFCDPAQDRRTVLAEALKSLAIPFELIRQGPFQHLQVAGTRPSVPNPGETVLLAHYDRVPGTPGANDNGASVLALVAYLSMARGRALRVVFTDGEELPAGASGAAQGAYQLARSWGPGRRLFPVVLDMTGIGDTLVLGHLGEHLVRLRRGPASTTQMDEYAKTRWRARRWLAACGSGDAVEVNTPFSDDLGLFLAGVPAVQVSILPQKQAWAYRAVRRDPGELGGADAGALPTAWQTMHTPHDRPEALWAASQTLILDALNKLTEFSGS